MKWSFPRLDWVTGISAIAVLGLGGAVLVGAPMIPDPASAPAPVESTTAASSAPSASADPRPAPEGSPTARKSKRPEPAGQEGRKKGRQRGNQGLGLVLPGLGEQPDTPPIPLVVSSFNVLGSSHTSRGGNKPRMAPGTLRIRWAAQMIRGRQVGIAGLQELEADQARVLMGVLPSYAIYPGPSRGRRHSSANSIIWRQDQWELVAAHEVMIPYFARLQPMPYIRLRHRATGAHVWVGNFHNPASSKRRGNNAGKRREATRRQIALANNLRRQTGDPVIFTGDFNERAEYFCRLVAGTALEASNGGSAGGGRCSPPANMGIDWVFGTPEIDWLSSVRIRGGLVRRTTDHPMVVAAGRLDVE